jgi:hypothetical protein
MPERAIESLGATDAFIIWQEASPGANFPAGPKPFSAKDGEVPEAANCLDNAEGVFFRE